ncbi:MAG: hypothetical protein GXP55_04190 [Deltaproteobacteria bacterium]|nr:hypothetical protein [Deltaproteobacteria bacterium]
MSTGSRGWAGIAAIAVALTACTVDNAPVAERDGDAAYFAEQVQPVIRRHCAFEGCHGREGMPLSLYAVDYLRLRDPTADIDPSDPPLDERALRDVELDHNRLAIAARTSAQDPAGDELILRLIPIAEGGIPHADMIIFDDLANPDLEILRRFLQGTHASP